MKTSKVQPSAVLGFIASSAPVQKKSTAITSVTDTKKLVAKSRTIDECALLSEAVLAKDWLSKKDEEAWKEFQSE